MEIEKICIGKCFVNDCNSFFNVCDFTKGLLFNAYNTTTR